MSCFFCSSNEHVTQNCNIYKSNEERREILRSKNRCQKCLTIFGNYSDCLPGKNCEKIVKCYCCFLPTHHTLFCPDRFTMPPLFPPKIDQHLFSRFFELLTFEEKCFLMFTFPINSIKIKPIKVKYMKEIVFLSSKMLLNADLMVADEHIRMNVFNHHPADHLIYSTVFRFKHLLLNWKRYSTAQALLFLSPKTKTFKFQAVPIQLKTKFRDILVKAPNLEEIDLSNRDIDFGRSWPEDILQLNCAETLQINFELSGFEFLNVKSLIYLIKNKDVTGFLRIQVLLKDFVEGCYRKFQNDLRNYFNETCTKPVDGKFWAIAFDNDPYCYYTPKF